MGQHVTQKVSNISRAFDAVPFHDFSWGTGQVTEGEKASAERGAASRNTLGAKRDRCKRGKSCGAACIFYRKDCVLDLPVTVQNAVNDMRNFLQKKVERGEMTVREASKAFAKGTGLGQVTNKRASLEKGGDKKSIRELKDATGADGTRLAQRRVEVREAVRELKKEGLSKAERREKYEVWARTAMEVGFGPKDQMSLPGKKAYDGVASEKQQARLTRMAEVEAKFKNGQINHQQYNTEMQQAMSWYRKNQVSDGEVRLMLAMVSPAARSYLETGGKVSTPNAYDGARPSSLAMSKGESPLTDSATKRAWAWQNMRIMMESNFQDVYTRQRYRILQVDLEHVTPESILGVGANMGINKAFTLSQINQNRSSSPLSYFSKSNPNGFFKGVLGPDGKVSGDLLRAKQEPYLNKMNLKDNIKFQRQSLNSILRTISEIPASELKGADRNALYKNIVSSWLKIAGGATIARDGRGTGDWQWFGGKKNASPEANALGRRIATKLAEFETQGDAGSKKMLALAGLMGQLQKNIVDINNLEFNGAPIRGQNISGNKPLKDLIQSEINARIAAQQSLLDDILGP